MIDIKSLVERAKEKYPGHYTGLDDEGIYQTIRKRYPNEEWPDLSPYGIDENSYGWMKSAYNNSLTGLTEQLVTGK